MDALQDLRERVARLEAWAQRSEVGGQRSDERLTRIELAARVGCSVRTIDYWVVQKVITAERIGGVLRFHWPTVDGELRARGIKSRRAA